jgi:hypothetical protein
MIYFEGHGFEKNSIVWYTLIHPLSYRSLKVMSRKVLYSGRLKLCDSN